MSAMIGSRVTGRCRPSLKATRLVNGQQQSRWLTEDVKVTLTGKPIIAKGPLGRSSRTGYTATVFGGPGFLGRYVVSRLARKGTITVVPFREEIAKRHLKVTGDLGVVNFLEWDLRNVNSIEEAVRNSDIVFNLVGRNYPTKNFSYPDVQVEGAKRIAEAVAKYDVPRLVHVSSHSASPTSSSEFYKTKFLGEKAVTEIVPDATIVRPGPMFGWEDKLLNRLSAPVRYFTANNHQEVIYPTHVLNVAAALEKIGYDDSTAGQTYELHGPKPYTLGEIKEFIEKETLKTFPHVDVPKKMAMLIAQATQYFWWPTTCPDEVERQFLDQKIDRSAKTFADLGIKPDDLQDLITHYLRWKRSNLYSDQPPDTPRQQREARQMVHLTN